MPCRRRLTPEAPASGVRAAGSQALRPSVFPHAVTRTPMTFPLRRRIKRFDTRRRAQQWAWAFSAARYFNGLPVLEGEAEGDEGWAVNPDVRAPAQPGARNQPKLL